MDLSPDEDNFQGRLLHQAALWDNVELLQELIAGGADVDARDLHLRSALHAAALAERSRCLRALCDKGADPDAASDEHTGGKTALHVAAERGHVENVMALVGAGASLNAIDANGDSALALAERHAHRHAAQALREARDAVERERLSQHAALRELVSRGEATQLRAKLSALGPAAALVANLTPGGANTLLYVAAEAGLTAAVSALLAAGADGRAHPVTRYGPLYIACYHGHLDIARLLLRHFPDAVQQETVEKWLPIHAACIGGHSSLVTLLLDYPYPPHLLTAYTDPSGQWQYFAAFDVNAKDVSGQSALYVASTLGNLPVVDALISHTVPAASLVPDGQQPEPAPASQALSPQRGISLGIHAIVSKLTGGGRNEAEAEHRVRPVDVDCVRGDDSCVACAARGGHVRVVRRLLQAGAKADAPAHAPDSDHAWGSPRDRRRSRSASARPATSPAPRGLSVDRDGPWTALAIAAHAKHSQLAELLLQHGAVDPSGRALQACAKHGLTDLLAAILATKAYADPEYKLNKPRLSEAVFSGGRAGDAALTYSALCPALPVMLNWRELRCQLGHLRVSWLRAAALRVNARLSGAGAGGALHSLTRIDVANNELQGLPAELFTMLSIRYLNAAQNKLERLPTLSDPFEEDLDSKGRKKKTAPKTRPKVYSAPVLQELYLQDNRLESLPAELFSLPALATLDVSNNKLRALPAAVWAAPALRDLNAALNHLRDLPTGAPEGQPPGAPRQPSSPPLPSPPLSTTSASSGGSPGGTPQFNFSTSKSWSRSPSIEANELEVPEEEAVPIIGDRAGNAVCSEARRAHAWRGAAETADPPEVGAGGPLAGSQLAALNLSHNQFSCVPAALACRAPRLTRLNMAYNSLRSMSYVTSYPTSLRQLDLSHNEITCWPSLPQVESSCWSEDNPLVCFCPRANRPRPRSLSGGTGGGGSGGGGGVRKQLLHAACPARRHLRLEGLRTLILANNLLTRIQLTTDDDGDAPAQLHHSNATDDDDEWGNGSTLKSRLVFPLLSMLDVSCNMLRSIPLAIHELTNLAVLNISGNKDITELPPQMGLLSRLWNLNTLGCSLSEPLRSMVASGRYKSMDVVGYLKSVLQDARPYTRLKLMLVGLQGIGKTSLLECLRQESAIQHRRKPTDHWAKRMGNKSSRKNMSTVGVDIGTWTYEKHRSSRGPITFRTWDFGGQQEYYATHQYFLSRRSLYLVVWRATDGRRGLAEALVWLRSIQARAPGSPVIMVATHYDQVANSGLPESESPEALQRLIRSAIMGAADADKLGLPRVMDSVEVSCSTRHNIRLLADVIYSVAFSVKPPGSKEPLLDQLVPATYLSLEECVSALAHELQDPVLRHHDYRRLVTQWMQQKNHRSFRDAAELHQATMFLHENGVLLHYDDATLKELYFLRPQWLCDVLAHVVTVREINPFANNGIMKVEDLAHVFKASPALARSEEARALAVSLLNKFELALCWDARVLLVPPLLPQHEPTAPQLPVRARSWSSGTPRRLWPASAPGADASRCTDSPTLIQDASSSVTISGRCGALPLRRLLLLSYVPLGFWARLCTRLLADSALADAAHRLYRTPAPMEGDEALSKALELSWGWRLWRSGLKLACGELTLLSLHELPATADRLLGAQRDQDHCLDLRLRIRQEGSWAELDVAASSCVQLLLPAQVCTVRRADGLPLAGYQSVSLEPNPETLAKVLALVSDHVDLLLEDWYPSLGTRFVHTSEGRCLITRVVPCAACLRDRPVAPVAAVAPVAPLPLVPPPDHQLQQAFRRLDLGPVEPRRLRLSEESRASDGDSGVGAESNASSRMGSVEGIVGGVGEVGDVTHVAHGWTVEECILAACTNKKLQCPVHAEIQLRDVAPDTLLLDVEERCRARWEHISRGAVAGRGAFGTVLAARWRRPGGGGGGVGGGEIRVALKALQPVPPPQPADAHALHAYKAALSRWERDPTAAACRAYCGLRQELGILSQLRHPHVVPLLAACAAPLALLLELAPQGALDGCLRQYRGCGSRLGQRVVRALALQAARALEYLHARRVVYRDLKSENVLVWALPRPEHALAAELAAVPVDVHVKLGDYGISRLAPPSGTKGFGGTEGFMAPEIMRYNGEEEYNEKVDCFSFGMLLYEIITLRQPFEGHEAVKEAVLEGARPALSPRELQYPCCFVECMRRCWAGAPALRPSAAALVCVCAAPEFPSLQDAACTTAQCVRAALAVPVRTAEEGECPPSWEVWCGGEPDRVHSLLASPAAFSHQHTLRVPPANGEPVCVTAMCRVGGAVWLGDSAGRVSVYDVASCGLVWSVSLHLAVGGAPSAVAALAPLKGLPRVALAQECGRLFLVSSEKPLPGEEAAGGFVLSELGAATRLGCLAALPTHDGVEVWAGGDGAGLWVYSVSAEGVSAATRLPAEPLVALLAAPLGLREPCVVSYSEPGVSVVAWAVGSREAVARLDCSKLVPCSESLQSIGIDERHEQSCRVTALCALNNELYIGTAWGCLIVTDAALRPLTVFRPYEQDVVSIVALPPRGNGRAMLATMGQGYRPLLQRYAPPQASTTNTPTYSGWYCLLWRASHWLPD